MRAGFAVDAAIRASITRSGAVVTDAKVFIALFAALLTGDASAPRPHFAGLACTCGRWRAWPRRLHLGVRNLRVSRGRAACLGVAGLAAAKLDPEAARSESRSIKEASTGELIQALDSAARRGLENEFGQAAEGSRA